MASGKGLMATTLDAQSGSSIRLIHTRRLWCSCGAGRISYTSQPYRTAWLGSAIGRDARRRILLIDSVGRKGPTPRGGWNPSPKPQGFEPQRVSNLLVMPSTKSLRYLCTTPLGADSPAASESKSTTTPRFCPIIKVVMYAASEAPPAGVMSTSSERPDFPDRLSRLDNSVRIQ
jgi:hypothetical protein